MITYSILLEKIEEEYYYRYISNNITYYVPSYTSNRLNKALSSFEKHPDFSYSIDFNFFLKKVWELGEYSEDYFLDDIKNTKELSLTILGYRYENYIVIIGSQKPDTLLEETLFKEDYIFLIKWINNKEEKIDNISDNVITLLEYTKEEILSTPYIRFIHPEDVLTFKEELNNFIEEDKLSFYQKYRLVSKSGKSITVLDHSCQIVRDDKKSVIGYLRDITLEVEMTSQIKELTNLDEENFKSSIIIKIEWDRDYKVTRWNTEASDLLGWESKDIVGKNIRELNLLSDEDSIKMQGQFKRLFAREVDNVISSFRIQKKQGGLLDSKWSNRLISRGGESRIVSSVIDQSQEMLLMSRLDDMEARSDLLLKSLSSTLVSNDVFSKLVHKPLTSNPEGLIKAEIIIRKLEEEITRLNDTIFHNNGNNLLTEVANLKYDTKDIREELLRVKESQNKVSSELSDLLNINILSLGKNLNFKNLTIVLVISYLVFAQLLPGLYIKFIKPSILQINKELKQVEGKKD